MLDWTWSPYVAAFFAFRHVNRRNRSRKKVRIFKLDCDAWFELAGANRLSPCNFAIVSPLAFGNSRAIPQQAVSIVSNIDDIESYIQYVEANMSKQYLEVFDLSVSEREHVMKELALMGITAGALFSRPRRGL